ncbi:hypothetical protein M407DRAFT_18654 [Tulasnella calospora MUT 4182]|uniref:RING-type domain-containing protein n=1 Tax=Tulasnella calospora MUT 4182 TaxID=1051891 RepID=A0A0C3QUZ3_9AGAM|nr:hypothetical protein M407DRAFT_18654 [Tulasnella calospora MUT 4182]
MSSQPSSPVNFTTAPTPKTPSSSTTASSNPRRVMSSTKSTASNNTLDTLSPSSSSTSPFTPFSARSGSLSRLSSAFNTPLQLDGSPTAATTSSKRAAASNNTASSSCKADFSDNWRAKAAGENVTAAATSPSFLRSPAFVSNDRRLPRALAVSQASPSTPATLASPKHRMSATTTTSIALASPIKYFSTPSSATNTSPTASRRRRVPLFDRSNLEALTAIADADVPPAGTKMLSDREDDILEDDAARAPAANNVHGHHIHSHLNSSSDSDFFIRMDAVQIQPRTLFRDYLSTTENDSSLSCLRNDVALINAGNEKRMEAEVQADYCSGCGSSSNGTATASSSLPSITLSYLQPCQHAICHQCFTGMLNIVGEKGLECPMCKGQVTSFDVQGDYHHHQQHSSTSSPMRAAPSYHSLEKNPIAATASGSTTKLKTTTGQHLPATISFASVLNAKMKMKAAAGLATADDVFSSTFTPSSFAVGDASSTAPSTTTEPDLPVLRIDNLPWDVTPQMLTTWLHPTTPFRTHILLERSTGKTLSHCFVELRTLQDARAVLRECQNKIIGTGKRTRAVSVTVSRQEEVMQNIFPNWRASFTSTSPSLEGLDGRQTSEVLKAGLLSYNELESLLQLMRNPESHFLKVPTLPFYAIASILQKFPGSGDESSGLFWSCALRDRVFAAVQILSVRVSQQDWDPKLLDEVVVVAVECRAFTEMQRRLISITANLDSSYPASSSADSSLADASSSDSVATPPPSQQLYVNDLEVPPPTAPSSLSTVPGGSPWYSRVVNNGHFSGGSTRPTAASNTDIKGSLSSSSLRMGNLDSPPTTTSPATHVGGPSHAASSSTTHHRQHPISSVHRQHRTPAPLILAPPSPTTTAGPSAANNNPRTLFEEIGEDVGVDAELVKMVVKRLFISQQ